MSNKMSVGKKIGIGVLIALCVLVVFGIYSMIQFAVSISRKLSTPDADDIVLAGEDVTAYLDENGFSYETDSTVGEDGFLTNITFMVSDREAKATLQIEYQYGYAVRFEIDDPYKDTNGKLYTLLPIVQKITSNSTQTNLEDIQGEEYFKEGANGETVYSFYMNDLLASTGYPSPNNYGFSFTKSSDGFAYSLYTRLWEEYSYMTA